MKYFAKAKCEIKSTHRRSDFTRRRRISYCEAIFHPPAQGWIQLKKALLSKWFFWLWTTKKIFLLVFRMNSNSYENEILADARMKSANADEIFGFASDEIKSTHPPSRRISPNEVGFHRRRRFHPPARVDLAEKSTDKVDAFFWWGKMDSNHRSH